MSFNFTCAPRTIFGEGALETAAPYIADFGKKALIVTGKIITKTGLAAKVQDVLSVRGISSVIFNDLPGEPDDKMIDAALSVFKSEKCDFIIGLGGGTPLDTAKAVAAIAVLPGKLSDFAGKEMSGDFAPLVLIPTTAGTGSEATKFFVYTDTATDAKLLMKGDALLPKLAVIDWTYTISSPVSITVATGMDALTHAVEAYTSKKSNPVTDIYCLDAIKQIFKYLPLAAKDGNDKTAREQMALAAYEAGVCINNSSVTLVHGMSRPIGAGKTTVFNLVSGFYVPSEGSIVFDGQKLNGLRPHKIADLHIGRTFQNIRLWSDMTVLDNICIAQHSRLGFDLKDVFLRTKNYRAREKEIHEKAWALLDKFSLADSALDYPKNLPYGIQRRVEIARALSLEPKLLLLDEPAAGLSTSDLDGLISYIRWIHDTFGVTIWMIEHQMQVVTSLCDHIKVINFGKELAEGTPAEIQGNQTVIDAYLGNAEIDEELKNFKAPFNH